MKSELNKSENFCPSPDISAYIDGELSADQELQLELHMAGCRTCSDDLNLQKSFLNALESRTTHERSFDFPLWTPTFGSFNLFTAGTTKRGEDEAFVFGISPVINPSAGTGSL